MTLDGGAGRRACARGTGWQATELRYMGADGTTPLAMTLILPDSLPAYEAALTPASLDSVQSPSSARSRSGLHDQTYPGRRRHVLPDLPVQVRLFLPRFGIDTRASLVPVLADVGLRRPSSGAADFSGDDDARTQLSIAAVIHQANIDVDEKGTEAAAATAILHGHHRRLRPGQPREDAHAPVRPAVPVPPPRRRDRRDPVHGPGRGSHVRS